MEEFDRNYVKDTGALCVRSPTSAECSDGPILADFSFRDHNREQRLIACDAAYGFEFLHTHARIPILKSVIPHCRRPTLD